VHTIEIMPVPCLALVVVAAFMQQAPPDQYFDAGGVRLRYVEQGSGEPVVLVHGFSNRLEIWSTTGIMPDLAGDHHVIAFDLRGHGKSGKPHDPARYGREMALDIVRLLDHLGLRRAHIVGYSLGAALTAQLLTLYPERFLSATLIAGAGRFDWDSAKIRQADTVANELEHDCISRSLMRRILRPDVPAEDSLQVLETRCFADSTQDRFALAAMTRSWSDQTFTPAALAAVPVPILALVGSEDPQLRPLQALVAIRPSIRLIRIDGATHAGARSILRNSLTLDLLRGFLAAHRAAVPGSH
jgi:pimeloyl-ACP methyl ester carboxylesterase